ncbi:MAG: hypothetical protein RSB82_02700 [Victivallaceae bacterium]
MKKNKRKRLSKIVVTKSASVLPSPLASSSQFNISPTEISSNIPINMSNQRIRNVANPTDPTDAVNAKYLSDNYVKIGDSSDKALFLSLSGGVMRGPINMNNQTLSNLPTPINTNLSQAANVNYVNQQVDPIKQNVTSFETLITNQQQEITVIETALGLLPSTESLFLKKTGGTMKGTIDMSNNFITNLATPTDTDLTSGANVQYVINNRNALQAAVNNNTTTLNTLTGKVSGIENVLGLSLGSFTSFLKTSGGTMTGPINMGNQTITNLVTPNATDPSQAANVDFVIKNSPITRTLITAIKQAPSGGSTVWNVGNYNYTWASNAYIQSDDADKYFSISGVNLIAVVDSIWLYWNCTTVSPVSTTITVKRDGVDYYPVLFSNTSNLSIQCFMRRSSSASTANVWISTNTTVNIQSSSWGIMKI